MSLKAFHIIFIAVSTLTAIGFGVWCFHAYTMNGGIAYIVGAVLSFMVAAGLILYGIWFLRKLKGVSFM